VCDYLNAEVALAVVWNCHFDSSRDVTNGNEKCKYGKCSNILLLQREKGESKWFNF
jgi:hypothetical protein